MATDPQFYNDQKTLIMPIIPNEDTVTTLSTPEPAVEENSPAVTLPQKIAAVVAGIPILCNLTGAFGIWAPNEAQVDALEKSGAYAVALAGFLVLGDAGVRFGRNIREGQKANAVASLKVAQTHAATQEIIAAQQGPLTGGVASSNDPSDPSFVEPDADEEFEDTETHVDLSDEDTPETPDASRV